MTKDEISRSQKHIMTKVGA